MYPESQFPKNGRLLRGFDWREDERPKSVEDLFVDDAPFELPVIKGMEDYIPPEEFFDETMIDRIEEAGKENTNNKKENKAARNIPKDRLKKQLIDPKQTKILQPKKKKGNQDQN